MVIFGNKMTAITFPIEWWDLISKMSRYEFLAIFFHHLYIHFRSLDLDLWPKVTNFNKVWASANSNHLAKTASKSVHPFGRILFTRIPDTRTDRQTDIQTNCSENITPPRFRGGVIKKSSYFSSPLTQLYLYLFIIYTCTFY